MAAACVHVMCLSNEDYSEHTETMLSHINVETGEELSIRELAETIRDVIGFDGELEFDSTKPDGTPRKLLDVSRLKELGWEYQIGLKDGLAFTYSWFLDNQDNYRN